jgi:predicted HicB family RNase H-like nuclease
MYICPMTNAFDNGKPRAGRQWQPLRVVLPASLHSEVKAKAARRGESMRQVVIRLLEKYVKRAA